MFDIAMRNLWRNSQRSVATAGSIAVGAVAIALFAAFSANITNGLQTETVGRMGHLSVFKQGFFQSGGGNTGAYGISEYKKLIDKIQQDPVLSPMVRVVTSTVTVGGIASSAGADASTTFVAQGVVPTDRRKMAEWNAYNLPLNEETLTAGIPDGAPGSGLLGAGLARILGICAQSDSSCAAAQAKPSEAPASAPASNKGADALDNTTLTQLLKEEGLSNSQGKLTTTVNLLAATAGGAPNVVQLRVTGQVPLGIKELDDRYVGMPLELAQALLFGRGEAKITAIVVQLHSTHQMRKASVELRRLIKELALPLEVFDFTVLSPAYRQINEFYDTLSLFLMLIFCVVALFMTMNSMTASIYERTREIGTLRALGMDRGPLRRMFVTEGVMLGVLGATLGVLLAAGLVFTLNQAGLTWMPPGSLRPVPMRFSFVGALPTIVVLWVLMVLSAAFAARIAAGRAAKMKVVDALRQA